MHNIKKIRSILLVFLFFQLSVFFAKGQTVDFTISQTSGCSPLSTNFTDISSGGTVVSRLWDLGNGVTSTAPFVGANYITPQKYYIRLTVQFSNGFSGTKTDSIVVHPKPIADFFSLDTIGCFPHTANFIQQATTGTGTIMDWNWDFSIGASTLANPAYSYLNSGLYQVSMVVRNSWGCISDANTKPQYIKVFNKPVAGFMAAPNFSCKDTATVNFLNTTLNTNGFTKYEWDFGDGSPVDTNFNTSHFFASAGHYTVTLKVSLGANCTAISTTVISIGKPTPSLNSFPDTTCLQTPTLFSGSGTPLPVIIKWLFSDDNSIQNGSTVLHNFILTGNQQVKLIATNIAGCSDTISRTIFVKDIPNVNFTANNTSGVCLPFTASFFNNSTGAHLKYTWNFGDGSPLRVTNSPIPVTHIYTTYGNFQVTLTAKDTSTPNGCSATKVFNAINLVQPLVNFIYLPPVGCKPLPVFFTPQILNYNGPVLNYSWNFGEGPVFNSTGGTELHIYNNPGNYNVQLTITTNQGCSISSSVKQVLVTAICDDDGSGTSGGGGFIVGKTCANKYEVNFTDTVSNSVVQSWDFGDGSPILNTGILNPVLHQYNPPQKAFIVTVTRLDTVLNIITTTQKRVIIIDEKANFAPNLLSLCKLTALNVQTIGIDSSLIKKYTWNFGDGTAPIIIDNTFNYATNGIYLNGNNSHTYADTGSYYIRLIIEDKLGCIDSFLYPLPIVVKGPVANFDAIPTQTCNKPYFVVFRDSSAANGSNAIVNRAWNFGDGSPLYNTGSDTNFVHQYNNNNYFNFYSVTLTVTDVAGCQASKTRTDYLKAYQPKADFGSNDTLICGNRNVTINNLSSAYNATYTWDYGDGSGSSGFTGSHLYSADGFYTVKLVAKDENGCKDSIVKPSFIKIVKPRADFTIQDSLQCAPAFFTFKDSSSYAVSYFWDFGDGSAGSTVKDPAPHIYGRPGYYTVTLFITGVSGCKDSISKQIRVRGPIGQLNASGITGCKPVTAMMRITGSFIQSYAWDFGDGTPVIPSNTDSIVTHLYPNVGFYIPNVVLTSNEGCSYTIIADTVFVDSVKAKLTIFNNSVCLVGSINTIVFSNFSQAPAFSGIAYSNCDFGDGSYDNTNQPQFSHSYGNPGVYDIVLSVRSKYGCIDTLRLEDAILVNSTPVVSIQGADTFCLKPSTIINYTSTVNSSDTIATYKWMIGADSVGNTPNLSVNYRKPGTHQLKFIVNTVKGCSAETLKIIVIDSIIANFTQNLTQSCGPANIVFQNNSIAGTNILYTNWTFGDGTASTQLQPNHNYNLTGTYNVKLLLESGLGCRDSSYILQAVTIDSIPKVTISGDSLQCKPGLYSFLSNVQSSDSIQQYEWRLNGTFISNSQNLSYNFLTGSYILSLKVTTIKGCQDSYTKNIKVDSVKANFNITPPNICGDTATIRFTDLSFNAFSNAAYLWSFGDAQTAIQTNPDHFYAQAGTYDISLKIVSVNGCIDSINRPMAVTIYPKPVISTIVPARACSKDSLVFIGSVASLDSVISKTWRINNVIAGINDTLSYVPGASGNYLVTFNVKTKYGCDITVSKNIIIDPLPVPAAGPNTTICLGSSITLNANDGVLFQWSPAATLNNSSVANPVATPVANTKYHVLVTNIFGCKQKDSVLIKTDGEVRLQVSNDAVICQGSQTQLNVTGNTNNFIWSPPAGLNNDQITNPVASPSITTQYMVVGYSGNVCKNDTGWVTVKVAPNPVISVGPDRTILAGVPTILNTIASPFVVGYNWTPATNLSCTNCPAPTFLPNTNTEFTVTAFTQYGCKTSDTIQIFVLCNKGAFYIPNAFTPNNDGKNDRFEIRGFGITRVNRLAVYDRYGHLIFERKNFKPGVNINDSWDGTVKGVAVSTATTFVYVTEVECLDGKVFAMKGTVIVVK